MKPRKKRASTQSTPETRKHARLKAVGSQVRAVVGLIVENYHDDRKRAEELANEGKGLLDLLASLTSN